MTSSQAMLALHVAMVAAFFMIAGVAGRSQAAQETTMTEPLDFATLEKATSPNRFLLAPEGLLQASEADAAAPTFTASPTEVFAALRAIVEAESAYGDVAVDETSLAIRFVATVPVFGFKDDVDAVVMPAGTGSTLAIYSRSRVGYGDFGVNRKRVNRILTALEAKLK